MKESRPERKALRRLTDAGHKAYFAGGSVRDQLLGREPLDYDIATSATPEEVLKIFPKAITVGAQFGVVRVLLEDSGVVVEVEVATFRSDHGTLDGRHPAEVKFTLSAEEDVQRRDFTINGLLYDPLKDKYLDFVSGQKDIEAGIVRAIGEPRERFAEDKLRLLRAVRFAARFGFQIEPGTYEAIREMAVDITQVSQERIRDELLKMLTEGSARRAFELLDETGLLKVVLPEVAKMKGVEQPPEFHPEGDVWTHVLMMLAAMESPTATLALGVLLHDVGKPPTFEVADRIRFNRHAQIGAEMAKEICLGLKLSGLQTDQVVSLVRNHLKFMDAPQMKLSTLKRFIAQEKFEEHLELHRLDCLASHGKLDNYHYVKEAWETTPEEVKRPPRLLTGHDLMAIGYPQGPGLGKILAEVEEMQLNGELNSPEEARTYVQSHFPLPEKTAAEPRRKNT